MRRIQKKRTVKLLLLSLVPFAVAYVLNFVLMYSPIPLWVLSVFFFFLWCLFCNRMAYEDMSPFVQTLLLNSVGTLMLILVLIQALIVKEYWPNLIGTLSQIYFLPLMPLAAVFLVPFMANVVTWPIFILEWVLMLAAAYLGCTIKRRTG